MEKEENNLGHGKGYSVATEQEDNRIILKTKFLQSIAHRRLKVFDLVLGMIAQRIILFRGNMYDPHLEDEEITHISWNKGVTDWSDYYRKEYADGDV